MGHRYRRAISPPRGRSSSAPIRVCPKKSDRIKKGKREGIMIAAQTASPWRTPSPTLGEQKSSAAALPPHPSTRRKSFVRCFIVPHPFPPMDMWDGSEKSPEYRFCPSPPAHRMTPG